MPDTRLERDSMGDMQVPADAYYGAQTARAVENFPISGQRMPRRLIAALGQIKAAAAAVNAEMSLIDATHYLLIYQAAEEVIAGDLDAQFVVDVYQTGSGTSTNMNINEVIAGRANELATGERGGKSPVHPNDHVNLQQSSNDVFPSAIHLSAVGALSDLSAALHNMQLALAAKAQQFDTIIKIGRTHLQDATPVRVGQIIGGWAEQVALGEKRCTLARSALLSLPLGGTAVGTGINSHPEFPARVITLLNERSDHAFREATNHFEAQSTKDGIVEASGLLRTIAVSLSTIANNIRHLSSGPRCGIGELVIPATQPGSSIMPGKTNPVMCEMLMMASARAIGADAAIINCAQLGSTFELNVMMPLMGVELLTAIDTLASAVRVFTDRCIVGIEVDRDRCESNVEQSLAMCTALAPIIGYDAAADLAKVSHRTRKTIRQVALERHLLTPEALEKALDPLRMTTPQSDLISSGGG